MHIQVLPEVLIGRLLFAKRSDGGEPQKGGGQVGVYGTASWRGSSKECDYERTVHIEVLI